jgi:type IV pilus assembly protein PilM
VFGLGKQKGADEIVGVEIEAGSVAAAQLRLNGSAELVGAAVAPLPPGAVREGEVTDPDRVVAALKSLFAENKLGKRVRLGVGNQRVVVRTLRLPAIEDPKEMEAAVRFRAQEEIPMPLDQAVLEYQVVGGVAAEEGAAPQVDVIVIAARREMVAALIEPVRAAGLDPVGVDLSAFGMIRALAGVGETEVAAEAAETEVSGEAAETEVDAAPASESAVLYCNVGDSTNLAVARGRSCLFTRVSTVGLEGLTARLGGEREISSEHAAQWIAYVGLEAPAEQLEGEAETIAAVRRVLEEGVRGLVDELRLSLDYYGAQESAVPVSRVVLAGPGSAVPGLADQMQAGLGLPISVARPAALGGYEDSLAARLTVPYGIALEG